MKKFVITTSVQENYAAHNGFEGTYAWKAKSGSNFIIHAENEKEAQEVQKFIEQKDDYFIVAVDSFVEVSQNFVSDLVKWQEEHHVGNVIHLDTEYKKSKNGDWYRKRGYRVSNHADESYQHLVGKFVGYVDNMTVGICVQKIEGDHKFRNKDDYQQFKQKV